MNMMMSMCCMFAIARLNLYSNNNVVDVSRTRPCFASSQHQPQGHEQRSFVVSYLVNSCGLSPDTADIVSTKYNHKLKFQSSQNPDSVLALLANHGFSKTQISEIVEKKPRLLNLNPDKNLLPKIQFLNSIGICGTDLAFILCSCPTLLQKSLEKQLVPCYHFLKMVVNLDDKQVIATLKRNTRLLTANVFLTLSPNVALLRQLGMPHRLISSLFTRYPRLAALKHTRFAKVVEDTRKMGFSPSKGTFVRAMFVLMLPSMTESKWESIFEVFGKWGWSKEDTLAAFRKEPSFVLSSEKKITGIMDFLVNKMGWAWASEQVAERPQILWLSLEYNIVPKCHVIYVLHLKGLIKQDIRLSTVFGSREEYFLDRYVTEFQKSVPKLLDLYEGRVDLQDCI